MFNANDLHLKLTAALGAVLVSFAFIGASVAPVDATSSPQAAATVRAISA